jgi:alpha-beta hydrolase superfamily lysophospholipase
MKKIKYNLCTITEGKEKILTPVEMGWNEANEAIAKREAHNGEYEIYDDGQPELVAEPTTEELLNAILGVTV